MLYWYSTQYSKVEKWRNKQTCNLYIKPQYALYIPCSISPTNFCSLLGYSDTAFDGFRLYQPLAEWIPTIDWNRCSNGSDTKFKENCVYRLWYREERRRKARDIVQESANFRAAFNFATFATTGNTTGSINGSWRCPNHCINSTS
jgi:hypothetical protein